MSETLDIAPQQASGAAQEPEKKKEEQRVAGFWWWAVALIAVTVLVGGPTYLYIASLMKEQAAQMQAAKDRAAKELAAKAHAAKEKIESAYFFRIDGKDTQGRAASFDFIILTGDYTWALGSTTEVISNGAAVPEADVAERVLSPKIRESLASASDLIAVGLASLEGEREQEEARALARAGTVAGWLTKAANPGTPLWTLTLGQYNKSCKAQEDADTSMERPLILSGVRAKAEGTNLQEALADAISGHDNLPSRECYSRFDMAKVR